MFFKSEIRKIFRFRIFWIMIAACLLLNGFLVISGCSFTGTGTKIINSYVRSGLQPLEDEWNFCSNFDDAKANAVHQYYDHLDIKALLKRVGTGSVDQGNVSNGLERFADKIYDGVEKRIEEIKTDGEAEQEYYVGTTAQLHNTLYGTVLYLVLLECTGIGILITSYIMNYEEIFHTHQNVYSSKKGRALVFSKGLAGAAATAAASGILIGVTLLVFFIQVPQLGQFWHSSVSSAMATEPRGILLYPFITWVKMSQLQYLLAVIALMLVYTILASLITFVFSFLSPNAFLNMTFTALTYLLFLAVWFGFSNENLFSLVQVFNPSIAMYAMNGWFMEFVMNPMTSYPGYETAVAIVYMVLVLIFTIPLWRRFKKKDI